MGARFTPTLAFLDPEGGLALKLVGDHRPYRFRAALEYVAGGHYREEGFRDYLARGDVNEGAGQTRLRQPELFDPPPTPWSAATDPAIRALLERLDRVQLDLWSDWATCSAISPAAATRGSPTTGCGGRHGGGDRRRRGGEFR